MPLDPREFRNSLGCFATGVTVITTMDHRGRPIGITANSFNSVSMDPPLVLFSLDRRAYSLRGFRSVQNFAINVLAEHQSALSNRFAMSSSDKWEGVSYETWETGCPILPEAIAKFECKTCHTYMGGDHVIFVGEVVRMAYQPMGKPLLYYQGKYRSLPVED